MPIILTGERRYRPFRGGPAFRLADYSVYEFGGGAVRMKVLARRSPRGRVVELEWSMPTVARIGPYRFFFYGNEGTEPPHIHVQRERRLAKFWLDPVLLA